MTKTSVPRLRSVRFKDGRASIYVLRANENDNRHNDFLRSAGKIAEVRSCMAGYVIVAWDRRGGFSVDCGSSGAPVPLMMLPEVVKTCVADWVHAYSND